MRTGRLEYRRPRRRGVSLLVAVVLLAVVGAVLGVAVRGALLHRGAADRDVAAVQSDLLADAATRRAAWRGRVEPWTPALPNGTAAVGTPDASLLAAVTRGGHTARTRRVLSDSDAGPASPGREPLTAPKPRPDGPTP